jgi:hypothetical protein
MYLNIKIFSNGLFCRLSLISAIEWLFDLRQFSMSDVMALKFAECNDTILLM